jgi:hypothetical protein
MTIYYQTPSLFSNCKIRRKRNFQPSSHTAALFHPNTMLLQLVRVDFSCPIYGLGI